MKIYIAGSISGNADYIKQFQDAETLLKAEGYEVINPAKNQGYSYKEFIDLGLYELMHCEAIYLLEGYSNSTGALLERNYAKAVGLKIIYQ